MSDHALKPAMPLINVDQDVACGPKQPGLKSGQLCCLGCSSTDGLSMLTIHDNQPAEESHCRCMGQKRLVDCTIG